MRKFEVVQAYADKSINIPKRETRDSAGYDLAVAEDILVPAMTASDVRPQQILAPTGLKVYLNRNEYLKVVHRSSLYKKTGLILSNFHSVIDADYVDNKINEGQIFIPLINIGKEDIIIKKGERLVQGIFSTYLSTDDDVLMPERTGGLGSTD